MMITRQAQTEAQALPMEVLMLPIEVIIITHY